MKAYDRTMKRDDYKGRLTDCCDFLCPCREDGCWHPHDCGYTLPNGKWYVHMECLTRWKEGCPSPKPEPVHITYRDLSKIKRKDPLLTCKRCGIKTRYNGSNFKVIEKLK